MNRRDMIIGSLGVIGSSLVVPLLIKNKEYKIHKIELINANRDEVTHIILTINKDINKIGLCQFPEGSKYLGTLI